MGASMWVIAIPILGGAYFIFGLPGLLIGLFVEAVVVAIKISNRHAAIALSTAQSAVPSAASMPGPIRAIRSVLIDCANFSEAEEDIVANATRYATDRHTKADHVASLEIVQKAVKDRFGADDVIRPRAGWELIDELTQSIPVGTAGYQQARKLGMTLLDSIPDDKKPELADTLRSITETWREEDQMRILNVYGAMKQAAGQALVANMRRLIEDAQAQGLDVTQEAEAFARWEAAQKQT
jgi:hypothetical protein